MRKFFIVFALLLFAGCGSKELTKVKIADMIINYYTPYSSTNILIPRFIDVVWIKKIDEKRAKAKVCYEFQFLIDYDKLVAYIKKYPNSNLARFDIGLVALLGRKFGSFKKGEIKSRCDEVEFGLRYGKWHIDKI